MLCERCNLNDATVHITKVVGGSRQELHYCESCARIQENIDFETPFTATNFLANLIDSIQSSPIKVNYIKTTTCSKCGMNYGKFKQTGRVGCDECYHSFEEKLMPLIKRVHGYDQHTGKIPGKASGTVRLRREIDAARKELQIVLDREEYEQAVGLRDRIRDMERQLQEDGGDKS